MKSGAAAHESRIMNHVILNILRVRKAANKKMKGGRKFIKLSKVATATLEKGKVGKFFWQRFDAKYESLARKRVVIPH